MNNPKTQTKDPKPDLISKLDEEVEIYSEGTIEEEEESEIASNPSVDLEPQQDILNDELLGLLDEFKTKLRVNLIFLEQHRIFNDFYNNLKYSGKTEDLPKYAGKTEDMPGEPLPLMRLL